MTEKKLKISYTETEESSMDGATTNINVGIFTTSQARLMLYEALEKLNDHQILYFDTDSLYYIYKPNDPNYVKLERGDYLGQLTDDLEGGIGEEFVSGGPKNYSLKMKKMVKIRCPLTNEVIKKEYQTVYKTKIKGFTLNIENCKRLNHKTIKDLVKNRNFNIKVNDFTIKKYEDRQLKNISQKKQYNFVYDKRAILPTDISGQINTVPFGYEGIEV